MTDLSLVDAIAADPLVRELRAARDLVYSPSVWRPEQISKHIDAAVAVREREIARRLNAERKMQLLRVKPGAKWG